MACSRHYETSARNSSISAVSTVTMRVLHADLSCSRLIAGSIASVHLLMVPDAEEMLVSPEDDQDEPHSDSHEER